MADIIQTPTIPSPTYANGILDYAMTVAPIGMSIICVRNMGTSDMPHDSYKYGVAIIAKRHASIVSVTLICDNNYPTVSNRNSDGSAWSGWSYGGINVTSASAFSNVINTAASYRPIPFSASTAATNSIFALGSNNSSGFVQRLSATVARGILLCGDNFYTFNYNPSTSTLTSINRLVKESEVALLKYIGSVTSSNPITINISGNTRFLMHLFGSTAGRTGTYNVWSTASANYAFPIGTAPSAITVDTATGGQIKLTNSGTSNCHVYLQIFEGSSYVSV